MRLLRQKWFVLLFFCLISSGHSYPYSYAWAMGQEAKCGCNLSGRKCIHGCDLKKKRTSSHDHAAMGHEGHAGHHAMKDSGHEQHADHGTKHAGVLDPRVANEEVPVWVNPDCSRQQRRQVLDFRGDPFLPQNACVIFQPILLGHELVEVEARSEVPDSLDPPPPKA